MLDKQSKLVLNTLIKIANTNNTITDCNKIYSNIKKYSKKQVNDSLGYLHRLVFIEVIYSDDDPYFVSIKYEGLNYKIFSFIEIRKFIFRSILTPVVVSVFTTLIALFLKGYFK